MEHLKSRVILCILIFALAGVLQITPLPIAHASGTITYAGNTITAIGGTKGDPITFWDIWNASNVNGWNVVNNTQNTQFYFWAHLDLGDSSTRTWFNDTSKQVTFDDSVGTAHYQDMISVRLNATFTIGEVDNRALKTSKFGCDIISRETGFQDDTLQVHTGGEAYVYSSTFSAGATAWGQVVRGDIVELWNSHFVGHTPQNIIDGDIHNVLIEDGNSTIYVFANLQDTAINRVSGTTDRGIYLSQYNMRITNSTFDLSSYVVRFNAGAYNISFYDVDSSSWTFNYFGSPTGECYRYYSYLMNITDFQGAPIESARVDIYNSATGNYLLNQTQFTGANGIVNVYLLMGFYNETGGNTLYSYNPYRVVISHDDYNTYTSSFNLEEAMNGVIALDTVESLTVELTFLNDILFGDFAILGFLLLLVIVAFLVKIGSWTGYLSLIPIFLMAFQYYDNGTDTNNLFWFFIGSIILGIMSTLISAEKMMNER